jgi:hypothetical protein
MSTEERELLVDRCNKLKTALEITNLTLSEQIGVTHSQVKIFPLNSVHLAGIAKVIVFVSWRRKMSPSHVIDQKITTLLERARR